MVATRQSHRSSAHSCWLIGAFATVNCLCTHNNVKCYFDSVRDRGIVFFQRRATETLFRYATRFTLLYCPFLPFFFFFVFFTLGRGAPLRAELHYVSASDQAGSLYREPVNFAIGIYDDQLRTMNGHDDSIPPLTFNGTVQRQKPEFRST